MCLSYKHVHQTQTRNYTTKLKTYLYTKQWKKKQTWSSELIDNPRALT